MYPPHPFFPNVPPPPAWQEHSTPDGRKYYYHPYTHVTQWHKPQELVDYELSLMQSQPPLAPPPQLSIPTTTINTTPMHMSCPWTEHTDPNTGQKYYYHSLSGASSWTMPPEYQAFLFAQQQQQQQQVITPTSTTTTTTLAPPGTTTATSSFPTKTMKKVEEQQQQQQQQQQREEEEVKAPSASAVMTLEPKKSSVSSSTVTNNSNGKNTNDGADKNGATTTKTITIQELPSSATTTTSMQQKPQKYKTKEEAVSVFKQLLNDTFFSKKNDNSKKTKNGKQHETEHEEHENGEDDQFLDYTYSDVENDDNDSHHHHHHHHQGGGHQMMNLDWQSAMKKIINDPRYRALGKVSEKQLVFEQFMNEKRREKRNEKREKIAKFQRKFDEMLEELVVMDVVLEHDVEKTVEKRDDDATTTTTKREEERKKKFELNSDCSYRQVANVVQHDARFQNVLDERMRQKFFDEFMTKLRRREKLAYEKNRKVYQSQLRKLMFEARDSGKMKNLSHFSMRKMEELFSGEDCFRKLLKNDRYQTMDQTLIEMEQEEERRRIVERQNRKLREKEDRALFRNMLLKLYKTEHKLNVLSSWQEIEPLVKAMKMTESNGTVISGDRAEKAETEATKETTSDQTTSTPTSTTTPDDHNKMNIGQILDKVHGLNPKVLFEQFIDELELEYRNDKKLVRSIMKNVQYRIDVNAQFEQFRDAVMSDEHGGAQNINPQNLNILFEDLLDHARRKAKKNEKNVQRFMSMLESLSSSGVVQCDTTLEQIEPVVKDREPWQKIKTDEERRKLFEDYVKSLNNRTTATPAATEAETTATITTTTTTTTNNTDGTTEIEEQDATVTTQNDDNNNNSDSKKRERSATDIEDENEAKRLKLDTESNEPATAATATSTE